MLRTNSKKVRDRVQKVIIQDALLAVKEEKEYFANQKKKGVKFDIWEKARMQRIDEFFEEKNEMKRSAKWIWDEYKNAVCRNQNPFVFENFRYFLNGLPSALQSDRWLFYESPIDYLGNLLEETKEERSRYDEWEAARKIAYLFYREIVRAL